MALSLCAGPLVAEDLRAEILDLLRARECAMAAGAMAEVFTVMGREAGEVEAALEALRASGSATLVGGMVTLSPELCRPGPPPQRVPALPWVEERLAAEPGCRRRLGDLAHEAEAVGIVPDALDSLVAALEDLGRVIVEGDTARLRGDLCLPGTSRDRGLDRVLSLGGDSFRAVLGMLAMERGCRLPLSDRETLVRDLAVVARRLLLLAEDLSEEASRALSRRIGQALEDPGPAFRQEDGALIARYCLP